MIDNEIARYRCADGFARLISFTITVRIDTLDICSRYAHGDALLIFDLGICYRHDRREGPRVRFLRIRPFRIHIGQIQSLFYLRLGTRSTFSFFCISCAVICTAAKYDHRDNDRYGNDSFYHFIYTPLNCLISFLLKSINSHP